jgi:hypothetical protein
VDEAALGGALGGLLPAEEDGPPVFRLRQRRAGDAERLKRTVFHEADRDLDGWLSLAELLATGRRLLLDADTDGSGALDQAEFSAGLGRLADGTIHRW